MELLTKTISRSSIPASESPVTFTKSKTTVQTYKHCGPFVFDVGCASWVQSSGASSSSSRAHSWVSIHNLRSIEHVMWQTNHLHHAQTSGARAKPQIQTKIIRKWYFGRRKTLTLGHRDTLEEDDDVHLRSRHCFSAADVSSSIRRDKTLVSEHAFQFNIQDQNLR